MSIELQIIVLFVSVFSGALLVDLFRKSSHLKLLLSFSGGYLLTIIFTHILPETYEHLGRNTGYFILSGFLLQLFLEYFSKGAEHGHTHIHGLSKSFPLVLFISLSVHAFVEAIPLTQSHVGHNHSSLNLFWGIILHKIPVAVALKTIFKGSGLNQIKAWIYTGVFALMAPLGLLLGKYLTHQYDITTDWILAVAIGMFLHISTTIIFESSEAHKINLLKLISILFGFGLGILIN